MQHATTFPARFSFSVFRHYCANKNKREAKKQASAQVQIRDPNHIPLAICSSSSSNLAVCSLCSLSAFLAATASTSACWGCCWPTLEASPLSFGSPLAAEMLPEKNDLWMMLLKINQATETLSLIQSSFNN